MKKRTLLNNVMPHDSSKLIELQLCDQFLVRQPRKGGLPIEKIDLMNTVNQLLLENNKLKDEKVTLEEEGKLQRRANAKERVKGTLTSRDVALCANNKVSYTLYFNRSKLVCCNLAIVTHGT